MVCFKTKNPNLGKFWRFLQWKILAKLWTIWSILRPLEIFYSHLVYFVVIGYIFPVLVSCTKKNLATLAAAVWARDIQQTHTVYNTLMHSDKKDH
jgi:hypothetical protein